MFKNVKAIKDMLQMLKEYEGLIPSYFEFVTSIKKRPFYIEIFEGDKEHLKEAAVEDAAFFIRYLRSIQ